MEVTPEHNNEAKRADRSSGVSGLVNFIKYNNTVPIVLGVIFLGSSAAFAATDPDAIYSEQQQVVSVDNTYIAGKDLSAWTPKIYITAVTEDADNYYVAYSFTTIDVVDYGWKDVTKNQVMTVSKEDLGPRDLGLYVTAQFRNIIANEVAYLGEVQEKAKNDTSQKVVATTYGGLIGKFLDSTTETLPGYMPVVQPPVASSDQGAAAATSGSGGTNLPGGSSSGGSTLLSLQVLGNNPARVAVGASYFDLGVVLLDPTNPNIGYHAFVNGHPSDPPNIDTSTTSVHIIEYRATDQEGVEVLVRRVVLVGDVQDPGGKIDKAGNVQAPPAAVPGEIVIPIASSTPAVSEPAPADTDTASTSEGTTPASVEEVTPTSDTQSASTTEQETSL